MPENASTVQTPFDLLVVHVQIQVHVQVAAQVRPRAHLQSFPLVYFLVTYKTQERRTENSFLIRIRAEIDSYVNSHDQFLQSTLRSILTNNSYDQLLRSILIIHSYDHD